MTLFSLTDAEVSWQLLPVDPLILLIFLYFTNTGILGMIEDIIIFKGQDPP
jgi:hypothetical protein